MTPERLAYLRRWATAHGMAEVLDLLDEIERLKKGVTINE